jgi:hypothetical protein
MLRVFASFRYFPAISCGLLIASWVVSVWWNPEAAWSLPTKSEPERSLYIALQPSTVQIVYSRSLVRFYNWIPVLPDRGRLLGVCQTDLVHDGDDGSLVQASLRLPIPMLLTVLLPIAAGALIRFRFPLWSYFAWTTLVAAEVAFYLR